jgi:hypothetical protein
LGTAEGIEHDVDVAAELLAIASGPEFAVGDGNGWEWDWVSGVVGGDGGQIEDIVTFSFGGGVFGERAEAESCAAHVAEELFGLLLGVRSFGGAFDVEEVVDAERELSGEFTIFAGFDSEDSSDLGTEWVCG